MQGNFNRVHRVNSSGFTLIETLVGTVLIAMVLSGMGAGLQVLNKSSSDANLSGRLDTMVSATGQVLKALPYEECPGATAYEIAFNSREEARPAGKRVLKQSASLTPVLSVQSVYGGPGCDTDDAGYQRIKYTIALVDDADTVVLQRKAEVVKFDPSRALTVPYAEIDPPQLETASGSAFATYSFTASGSSSEVGISEFRWSCGQESIGGPDLPVEFGPPEDRGLVFTPDDSNVRCTFPASTTQENEFVVSLEVTDNKEQTATATISVKVAMQDVALPLPKAVAAETIGTTGIFPLTTQFSSAGSGAPGGTVTYSWDFGDPAKGDANFSTASNPTHTYDRTGDYKATLTVTDQYGQTAQSSVDIHVTNDPNSYLPPTAVFTVPDQLRYAPTVLAFDGRQSKDASNNSVRSYSWEFGDGKTSTIANPNHTFEEPNNYNVVLTVTDSYGNTASFSKMIKIVKFEGPSTFRLTRSRSWLPLIRGGWAEFGWTNPAKAPGEAYDYQFKIDRTKFLGFVGCPFGNMSSLPQTREAGGERSSWQWNGDFCAGSTYSGQMRIKRTGANIPGGSAWSTWSPAREWTI